MAGDVVSTRIRFARHAETTYRVEVLSESHSRVSLVDGSSALAPLVVDADVQGMPDGRILLAVDGVQCEAWVADVGDRRAVFLDGQVHHFEVSDRHSTPARRRGSGPDSLTAPMPATVIRVLTTIGAQVRRGEPLVLLEAMKMELPLKAPHDGVVRTITCAAGDLVQPGVPLIELSEP